MSETTGNRIDRHDDRPNYSWLGLLGLLGLAGLTKKRHEDPDHVAATPRRLRGAGAPSVTQDKGKPETAVSSPLTPPAVPVKVVEQVGRDPMDTMQAMIAPVLGPLGTAARVLLLLIFMLLQREDLRSRLIRLVGQGRISATIRAMDDAGGRVARDRRFANNPLLKEHGVRFYAGVPILAPNGQPIGSLCLMDMKPRQLTEREKRLLREYANEVTEEIAKRAPYPATAKFRCAA